MDVAQLVEHVPCLHKTPGSPLRTLSTTCGGPRCDPSTRGVEARGLEARSHPRLHSGFEASLRSREEQAKGGLSREGGT